MFHVSNASEVTMLHASPNNGSKADSAGNCMSGKTPEIRATATTSYVIQHLLRWRKRKHVRSAPTTAVTDPNPLWTTPATSASQVISAMAIWEAGILCVDKMGSPCTRIGCLCLQMGHSKFWRHWIRQSSTRHLEWKAWLQYSCPEKR